jgi:hypothetical protein
MTIRYATIWNDQRRRAAAPQEEEGKTSQRNGVPMENAPAQPKKAKAAKASNRKMCSGERLAALLDTHRWAQKKSK